jgi:hypothetical protein
LELESLEMPDGEVSITAVNPRTGHSLHWHEGMKDGALVTELPGFDKDLALRIVPVRQAGETSAPRH